MAATASDILRDVFDTERLVKKLNETDAKKHRSEIHESLMRYGF